MAKGHLSEDTINFIMTAESSQLQQEIHKSAKVIDDLKKKEADLRKEQAAVKTVLGEESKEYKDLQMKIKKVTQEIADENLKLTEMHKRLGTSSMTMTQLRKEAKQLQRQLDNTSQALNPEEYEAYASKLREIQQRIEELKNTAKGLTEQNQGSGFLSKFFGSKIDIGQLKTFLAGNAITKFAEIAIESVAKVASRIKDLVAESVEAARAAEGITHAFEKMNQPGLLDNLRRATNGTVSDLELMKAAVQAQDFRLPLDQLGKYLEFAQMKARDTGQSVDYLVNSIVTGLGRKSVMILDNLGLSAAQINEEMAKGGDMAVAVGRIIDQQLSAQGEHFETAAERETKATTDVTNAQLELGNQMQKTFGIGSTSFSEMQAKAEAFILKGLTKLIIYCQNLYNKLGIVRAAVETVKVVFDTLFKACEIGFLWIIDTVKGVGRVLRDLTAILEGVFTFRFDKAGEALHDLLIDIGKTAKEFIADGKDVGKRWGQNVVDGINATMGKAKITTPKAANELDGVTVTGKKKDRAYWEEQVKQRKEVFEATKKGSKEAAAALKELKEAEDKLAEYNTYSSGKSGKSTKSDKTDKTDRQEDKDALKLQKEARQKLLDQERFFNEASVRSYKKQLAEKQISQSQFEAMQLSLQVAHADRMVNIEKEQLETIQAMTFKDGKQKEIAIAEQQRNIEKAENDAYNARTAAYQNFQKNMEQLETSGMNATQREEYAYQLQMKTLEGTYQASVAYAREHNQSLLEIDEAYQTAKEKLETDHTQKLEERKLQIRKQYQLATQGELMQADMDALLRQYDEGLISLEDYYKARESIEQEYEDRKQQVRQQYGLVTKAEEYQAQMDQLKQYLDQELLTTEEYEKAKKQLRMQNLKESFDYWQNQVSTAVSALQDAEMAQVDAKYDAEIAAAKKAGKDTTQLEAKKEEEKLKIQKKYADVNFAVKCAEIVSNTAVSIMKALAELGPIAGPIAAGLMAVTGAAQLAIAKAERDRVKNMTAGSASSSAETGARVATGKEEGGYMAEDLPDGGYTDVIREQDGKWFRAKNEPDRRGYIDRPTVIVGEGPAGKSKEWVASNAAVENPTVRPVIDAIDQAQRTGNVRTLDLRKVLLQRGLQAGGYLYTPGGYAPGTGTPSGNAPGTTQHPSPNTPPSGKAPGTNAQGTDAVLTRLTDVLDRIEQNGIPALVGVDQIEASQKQRDQARAIATK